jgi:hypothetical protein
MSSFFLTDISIILLTFLLICSILLIGFLITRIKNFTTAIVASWLLVIFSVIIMERLCENEGAGYRMFSIIMVTLFAMKAVVTVETYKSSDTCLSFLQWLAFSAGWFGMRPQLFEKLGSKALPGAKQLILFGSSRIVIGILLIFSVKFIGISHHSTLIKYFLTGILLAALSLVLHFGILNVSAGMWRLSGVNTATLFRSPFISTSLTEFWGKRWNLAFSEMTAIALYRPLKKSLGISGAMIVAFLFSGLLHEMAISVPVKSGLGYPLLYFLIHGLLMLLEKILERRGVGIFKNKIIGRVWVVFWLLLPLPILFHSQFIKNVVWVLVE